MRRINPPDEAEDYGPAMLALNERQRIFVLAYLAGGGKSAAAAAFAAGYGKGSRGGLDVQAHRLVHRADVLAGIREESLKRMHAFGPEMFNVIVEIARDKNSPAGERRKSAEAILDRIGLQAVSEHVVTVQDNRSRAELIRELVAGLRELGGEAPKLIDVTPEKVTDE